MSLCVSPDPRIPLADLCSAAENDGDGPLQHAEAYRGLLVALLAALDEEIERAPERWPAIDPERTLLHQLHRLAPEEIRALALRLARREGVGAL